MSIDANDSVLDPDIEGLVSADQAAVVCRSLGSTIPISVFLALSVSYILWHTEPYFMGAWFFVVLGIAATRYGIFLRYSYFIEHNIRFRPKKFLDLNFFLSLFLGFTWGFMSIRFLDNQSVSFVPIFLIICGISSGSSMQGAASLPATLAFNLPLIGMTTIKLWFLLPQSRYPVTMDMLLYCAYLVRGGHRAQKVFTVASRLKLKAAALAASLKIERDASISSNARLHQLANSDPLTGLSNRAAFSRKLEEWLEAARAGQPIFLFLIDLDHFKAINDTLGHKAGDDVLKEVAARLRSGTGPDDVVARLGGDEFAILSRGDAEASDAAASHLITITNGVFMTAEHPVTIGISIGIANYPEDCATGDDLLVRADLALYAAKAAGRQRSMRFDQSMLAEAELARAIEQDLPGALQNGAVEVWYQPQIALENGALVGLEALIRWNHPVFSWIDPPRIIAAALRANMSRALTGYVLMAASAMIEHLDALGFRDVLVSVNISPNELDRYALPDLLHDMIAHHGLDARHLELEITEDAFVSGDRAIATLKAISAMNIRLSIDDFGTGCSSIAYFRMLQVDRIKIDRSFVTGFTAHESDRVLVKTMLGIGRSLDIEIVAEGVETEHEASMLREFGCPIGQGYFFARALSPSAFDAWIAARMDRADGDLRQGPERGVPERPSRNASDASSTKGRSLDAVEKLSA